MKKPSGFLLICIVLLITIYIVMGVMTSYKKDILGRLIEIIRKYSLDDYSVSYSVADFQKLSKDLNDLKIYIKESSKGKEILPFIEEVLNRVTDRIDLQEYENEGTESFTAFKTIKDQALNSNQIMSINSIKSRKEKIRHTEKLREKIFELMGYSSVKKSPLNTRAIKKVDCGEYITEEIIFDSEPGISVPGYLLIPKNISFPAPAIIALHEHAGEHYFGADRVIGIGGSDPNQLYAKELCQRGYITLAIDARSFGRRSGINEFLIDYLGRWIGKNLFGMIIWDDIRSVDYLLTRKEVDPNRIGCIGHSLGGARATYLAALDERIKVVVISGYVTSYKSVIKNTNLLQPPSTWLPGVWKYADCKDALSLIAPRPLLIVHGKRDDIFSIEGMLDAYKSLKKIYAIFEAEDRLKSIVFDGRHGFPEEIHEEAYQWFDKWLKKGK